MNHLYNLTSTKLNIGFTKGESIVAVLKELKS